MPLILLMKIWEQRIYHLRFDVNFIKHQIVCDDIYTGYQSAWQHISYQSANTHVSRQSRFEVWFLLFFMFSTLKYDFLFKNLILVLITLPKKLSIIMPTHKETNTKMISEFVKYICMHTWKWDSDEPRMRFGLGWQIASLSSRVHDYANWRPYNNLFTTYRVTIYNWRRWKLKRERINQ